MTSSSLPPSVPTAPPSAPDGAQRLAALQRYAILDTPPEAGFDDIVAVTATLLDAPIAAVNLLADHRQWFKAERGLGVREMPLDDSICIHALLAEDLLVVDDLQADERFACNPLVQRTGGLRFYAGALLRDRDGIAFGTLCVLDTAPRPGGLSPRQRSGLLALAGQVMAQMEMRRLLIERDAMVASQRAHQRHYRQILDSAIDYAIVAMDHAGIVTSWNRGAEHVLGWTESEMTGQSLERIFTPDDRAAGRMEQEMRDALATGVGNDERWHLHRSGQRFWASGEMTPLRSETGAVVGFLKVLRDRTREREAREALRDSELRLRLALDLSATAVWEIDVTGQRLYWDRRAKEMAELPPDQEPGYSREMLGTLHPEDRSRVDAAFQAAIRGEDDGVVDLQYRIRGLRTRRPMWVAATGRRVVNGDGSIRLLGIARDITEERKAEESLRELAGTLEAQAAAEARDRERIWRVSREIIVVARIDGMYETVNPAFGRILGWSPEEATRRSSLEFFHPDDASAGREMLDRLASGATTTHFVCRFLHRDGGFRWLDWTAVPDGDRIYAMARDITAEQEQAAALARTQEQLRQSQKMEAIGQLTGGIAHDFNNMLQGIVVPLQLIQRKVRQGSVARLDRYVSAGIASAQRAAALTQRLLAFSRRQPLDSKAVDLGTALYGLEDMLQSTGGENIRLELSVASDLWPALTDMHQFESAVLNLAINARDAMPEGGRLRIAADNVRLRPEETRGMQGLEPGDYVRVLVADTGVGMPAEVLDKAFEPFFTTKPIGQGTGLGLSMIYGYARQSGGHIAIDSRVGAGTVVSLYLLRAPAAEAPAPQAADGPDDPAASTGTVLVVEDDAVVRMLAIDLLHDQGYRVVEARDGHEAMAALAGTQRFDLLLSDVGLPGPNGRQVADFARERFPGLPVILMTGYAEEAAMRGSFLGESMGLLVKPFGADALVAKVAEALRR
ncbi:MAG: PAS domain S-box protein [Xylophilus ampelinus]